ncbi:hypothetical protein [Hymenobacter sp. PAMC 26628]|uniref:hypothetical protein n=1 Tax=Hymenobacter sp. PAMC 26628 TaxID=1484118 RepID=UPI000770559B|nr:hypothetical protein [Hymenobacter sp. PAMC 26628]AMJ65048.1 hypothetical protein AXW84_06105 [Hymenobacter sp. PAMC 26628]
MLPTLFTAARLLLGRLNPAALKAVAVVLGLALLASAGCYGLRWLERRVLARHVNAAVQHHAAAVATDAQARARADSTANYRAGQRAALLRNAYFLQTEDEKLTTQRPAPYELPADPPRE